MSEDSKDTVSDEKKVVYRCACGADVLLAIDGSGLCTTCERTITFGRLDPTQTVSYCAEIGSGTSFHLSDGPDRTGESLGHFRLMAKLGFGGMGAVYRALDESLQRFVAVKVIRSPDGEAATSRKQITRLLDEAVAQARLNHPNVVTIYYVGREGEEPFFAMELLRGPTLAHLIEEEPLPYDDVIHFARQICSALAQANRLGLVHGDIKPGNLILADDTTVKLSDFGLARTEDSKPSHGISGTLTHLAPELSGGGKPSSQSDMYSLGVTLFELAFGRRPYTVGGTTIQEQLWSHRNAQVEFPKKWPSSVPKRFRVLLERLLARNPEDRFESFEALESSLKRIAPVGITPASFMVRGMALVVDYAILGLTMLPFLASSQLAAQGAIPSAFRWTALLVVLPPLLASWSERRGVRTIGRFLMQLRVVDEHGVRLGRKQRFWRSIVRYLPVSFVAISTIFIAFEWGNVADLLSPMDELALLVNMIPALGPGGLALHDRLVGSRVVLATHGDNDRE